VLFAIRRRRDNILSFTDNDQRVVVLCHRERGISYRFVEKLAYLHYTILLLAAILLLAFRWNRRSVHKTRARAHTHTHTRLTALFPGLPW